MQTINHAKHTIKILNILKYTARYTVGKMSSMGTFKMQNFVNMLGCCYEIFWSLDVAWDSPLL